jgi:hypothetical protein
MEGLSKDIEKAIIDSIQGMVLSIDIKDVNDEKLSALMKSRLESFSSIKDLIMLWQQSPNAPSHEKITTYANKLIKAGEASIKLLRSALVKKTNFEDLDAEKYSAVIKSKPLIFRAINEINSGLIELRNQVKSGNIDFKSREFMRGYPERFSNQEFYPESDYYKEWYNKEEDAIMIDPKGTKGEIIVLDNLKIQLPVPPKDKKQILFSNLPIEEQYWRRTPPPTGLTPENENMYAEYIMEEFRRRREGVWFMNNGKPTWVTPSHYMGLQHNKMLDTGTSKDFRIAQMNMYYFTLACIVDKRCVGELFVKGRRTGYTEEIIDHLVNDSTSMCNALMGITSKTGGDAEEAFLKYQYVIRNLPFYFIPVVQNKIENKSEMVFGKPSDGSKANKKLRETSTDDYLNTKVDWMATATLAYDSKKLIRYLNDESGKWERPHNIIDHWSNVKPTMITGGRIVGKCFMGSTLNPLDKGGREFMQMYYGSDITKRNENGRTTTGLYSFFLPAHKNMEDYTDKYGVCHEIVEHGQSFKNTYGETKTIGSLQFLMNEFASAKKMGSKVYNNARRLDPITIDDAFRDELKSQLFDVEKINCQIKYNKNPEIQAQLMRGNFYWKDGLKDTTVVWRPEDNGRFLISWLPPEDFGNKFVKKNIFGQLTKCPVNEHLGGLATDPYDSDDVVDSKLALTENGIEHNKGSKGSIHGLTGNNLGNVPSNFFFLEYIARPKIADIFFEDVLMACLFYSMPILVENNKKLLLRHLKVRGYRGFVITRFDKDQNRLSLDEKNYGGIPNNSEDIKNYHWIAIQEWVDKYVGEYKADEGETLIREEGVVGNMYFNRTLEDWLKFDPNDRTKRDASISSGFAILAVNRHKYKPQIEAPKLSLKFKTY